MASWKESEVGIVEHQKAVLKVHASCMTSGVPGITPAGQTDLLTTISLLHHRKLFEIPALHYGEEGDYDDIQFTIYGDLNGTKLQLATVCRNRDGNGHADYGPTITIYYGGYCMRLLDGVGYLSQSLGIVLKNPDFQLMEGEPPQCPMVVTPASGYFAPGHFFSRLDEKKS